MQSAPQSPPGGQAGAGAVVPDNYKWLVLFTVVFGAFASILDTTIVNTALPSIQHSFGADLHLASYVATAYILAAGVVVPASAYLANQFGIKRVYTLSLALFTITSALCGLAPNIGLLIVFRILQGAAGAALFPLSFALLFSVFAENERGKANGIFGIPVLAAPALGPTIGGFLSQYADWRWVFYVNLPVGIIGVVLAIRVLRETPTRSSPFDLPGFALVAAGLGLLLFGLSNLAYDGWGYAKTVSGPVIASLVLLAAFVLVELRTSQPLLNLKLYLRRNFTLGTLVSLIATVGLFGPGFLLPQYLQGLRGQTPSQSGLLLLWQGVGAVAGTIITGQIYNRVGPKILTIAGAAVLMVTSFLLAIWTTATSDLVLLSLILLVRGFGLPLTLQSINTLALSGIRGPNLPQATTLNVVARNVVGSLAIAILTNYLDDRRNGYVAALGAKAVQGLKQSAGAGIAGISHLPEPVRAAIASAYHDTFVICGLVTIPALLIGFLLQSSPKQAEGATANAPQGARPEPEKVAAAQ